MKARDGCAVTVIANLCPRNVLSNKVLREICESAQLTLKRYDVIREVFFMDMIKYFKSSSFNLSDIRGMKMVFITVMIIKKPS